MEAHQYIAYTQRRSPRSVFSRFSSFIAGGCTDPQFVDVPYRVFSGET